jgi:hypothetical protein
MFIEALETGSVTLALLENRKSILEMLTRFRRRILHGTWRVPVFGAGGTGKTTMGTFLAGEFSTDVCLSGYRESIASSNLSLPGNIPCKILVPPGQERRRDYSWPELYRLLASGKASGVLNVVSWGCHSTEIEYSAHLVHRVGISELQYQQDYLQLNREEEIKALKQIAPHLIAAKKKIWMITLVTKQDLWWNERHTVQHYYEGGEYAHLIDEVARAKGAENFMHNYFSVSIIPQNLVTKDGRTIVQTAAGYDQLLRLANLNSFVKGLNELLRGM